MSVGFEGRLTWGRLDGSEGGMLMPVCPHLPTPRPGMDWRVYQPHGATRGAGFYGTALEYGHALWLKRLPARAILCLDRAMGAELGGGDAVLKSWPMPYAAIAWMLREVPRELFCGNARVHFQHYADRMNEPRKALRQARAWACWAIACEVRPDLEGDRKHEVQEPTLKEIEMALAQATSLSEAGRWRMVLNGQF